METKKSNPVEYLTKEKKKELEAIFALFDKDEDDFLNQSELMNFLKAVNLPASERDVDTMMRLHDYDLSGLLSYDEWVSLVTKDLAGAALKDDTLLTAFKILDEDMDGFIFEKELKAFADLTDEEAKALFTQMDLNNDGRVNFTEFLLQFFHESDIVIGVEPKY
mmetsp:Transcript_276/g.899  ORF Transcript_276/g.899 Transcript_276/m.899 type:complete len:164 (+) Transcript_276:118-609(+)